MEKLLVIVCLFLVAIGCAKTETMTMETRPEKNLSVDGEERFTVNRIGVFRDDLAYGGLRGIYLVKDHTTGQEFVAISGLGLTELSSHRTGRLTETDER